jgi:hypothetical protein
MLRNVGKMLALIGLATRGSKIISYFRLKPKHAHTGHIRVHAFKETSVHLSCFSVSRVAIREKDA